MENINNKFSDIFKSINLLHEKYRSKEFIEKNEILNKDSKEIAKILEKYKIK